MPKSIRADKVYITSDKFTTVIRIYNKYAVL